MKVEIIPLMGRDQIHLEKVKTEVQSWYRVRFLQCKEPTFTNWSVMEFDNYDYVEKYFLKRTAYEAHY